MVTTYLFGVVWAAAGGLLLRRRKDGAKEPLTFGFGKWEVPVLPFLALLGATELVVFINHVTYASYVDTPQSFLLFAIPYFLLGLILDLKAKAASMPARRFLFVVSMITLFASFAAPDLAPMGPDPVLTAVWVLISVVAALAVHGTIKERTRFKTVYTALTALALLLPTILGAAAAPYPTQNALFNSLQEHQTTDAPNHYIVNTSEIRVISWKLATAYLHRAYGDAASYLSTDDWTLHRYTDPSYLNGRFVWVNVPVFEVIKWFGDRDHPAFVYIENVPENMSQEEPNVLHKVNSTIDYHMERIEWSKRINQKLSAQYSDYVLIQSRIDMDDSLKPFMVLYLGRVSPFFAMPNLELLVLVDLATGAQTEYKVTDPAIPAWLEVVYPDWYVYQWVEFWAHNRLGWSYTLTNRQHLYYPDDSSARFLVINGTTYWQVPLVQTDSHVLGGYVTVETRTGAAVFYNREVRSYADYDTAETQVLRYLTSGELGFQHLDINEGYLYPFLTASGAVREAYVFPLYAGFSILKYAILDAQEYTSPPFISESLQTAVEQYSSHAYGAAANATGQLGWGLEAIQNAYVGKDPASSVEEAVLTINNTTYIVTVQELRGGLIARGDDEWRELNLAIAEFQRTGTVNLWVTTRDGSVLDVDFEGADLVTH